MTMRILAIAILISMAFQMVLFCHAEGWNFAAQQKQLMEDVNAAQKSKALTKKDSIKLRKALAKIAKKKRKFKSQNVREFTPDNKEELDNDRTGTSHLVQRCARSGC
ncbi:MAG: hypothetical protein K8F91_09970 [Candidatus Obscuribacterales bacterium]|nr:hypothetical protein [Candidatus Obscuribacterales bacterium]